MKRIAIATITAGMNFGNRLQNYALQIALERLGYIAETIFSAKNVCNSFLLSHLRWLARGFIKLTKRQYYFDNFNRIYIRAAPRIRYFNINESGFELEHYDAAIAGSDQVWNNDIRHNSDFEFLPFVPPQKRFSYAASFGSDDIPAHRREAVIALLNDMREISVREETGRELVKKLTGRDAHVHIDPTMLLNRSDYERLSEKPPQPLPERYLLTYFLDEASDAQLSYIDKTAKELSLPVIALNELRESPFYNMGPQHFLYIIQNADYICTNSFHGTVFSVLFHRPFASFYRLGHYSYMNSRIDMLLKTTGLEDRLFTEGYSPTMTVDYSNVDALIECERQKAIAYLQNIIDSVENSDDRK